MQTIRHSGQIYGETENFDGFEDCTDKCDVARWADWSTGPLPRAKFHIYQGKKQFLDH